MRLQLIVQTKSEYLIKKNYLQKISGKTHPPKKELGTVRLIIGEAIRILRSRFTNITNPLRGRKGNASKGVFQKHLFDNIEDDYAHDELGTVAFLVINNDSIWYEKYLEDSEKKYGPTSKTNSFSMAKSITSALLGKAIQDGYIKS